MSAEDITLEDLEYKKKQVDGHWLMYNIPFEKYVNFHCLTKHIETCGTFNMIELQAIYNKCKELGWLSVSCTQETHVIVGDKKLLEILERHENEAS